MTGIENLTPAPEAAPAVSTPPARRVAAAASGSPRVSRAWPRAKLVSRGLRRTIRCSPGRTRRLSTYRNGGDGTMVKAIKKRMRRGTELTALAMATFGLFMLAGRQVVASETRTVPVTINAGEAYTIGDVSPDRRQASKWFRTLAHWSCIRIPRAKLCCRAPPQEVGTSTSLSRAARRLPTQST